MGRVSREKKFLLKMCIDQNSYQNMLTRYCEKARLAILTGECHNQLWSFPLETSHLSVTEWWKPGGVGEQWNFFFFFLDISSLIQKINMLGFTTAPSSSEDDETPERQWTLKSHQLYSELQPCCLSSLLGGSHWGGSSCTLSLLFSHHTHQCTTGCHFPATMGS